MIPPKIILASASPRRRAILKDAGIEFQTIEVDFDEDLSQPLSPRELAISIAIGKARAAMDKLGATPAVIIAADTFIVLDDKPIGKPRDEDNAKDILRSLSGRSHVVITGIAVLRTSDNKMISDAVESKVYFKHMTDDEIDEYVKTGEPMGKAGAYAVQGIGAKFIDHIEGDYLNVVGLPTAALTAMLNSMSGAFL